VDDTLVRRRSSLSREGGQECPRSLLRNAGSRQDAKSDFAPLRDPFCVHFVGGEKVCYVWRFFRCIDVATIISTGMKALCPAKLGAMNTPRRVGGSGLQGIVGRVPRLSERLSAAPLFWRRATKHSHVRKTPKPTERSKRHMNLLRHGGAVRCRRVNRRDANHAERKQTPPPRKPGHTNPLPHRRSAPL
jgi:hypothetical protein